MTSKQSPRGMSKQVLSRFERIAIFHAPNVLSPPQQFNYGPVTIRLMRPEKHEDVRVMHDEMVLAVVGVQQDSVRKIVVLEAGKTYFTLVAGTVAADGPTGLERCERLLDASIAAVSLSGYPDLVRYPIFRGWYLNPKPTQVSQVHVTVLEQVHPDLSENGIGKVLADSVYQGKLDDRQFQTMAYLYGRAMSEARLELRFLQLWFALEVFPMVGTSDISPISEYLAQHVLLGITASEVKEKLEIGRLNGLRSVLVHGNRDWREVAAEVKNRLPVLEGIVAEIMCTLVGQSPKGRLMSLPPM